jgi:hypothetical protein
MHHGQCTGRLSGIIKGYSYSTILFEIVVVAGFKATTADKTVANEVIIWTAVQTNAAGLVEISLSILSPCLQCPFEKRYLPNAPLPISS